MAADTGATPGMEGRHSASGRVWSTSSIRFSINSICRTKTSICSISSGISPLSAPLRDRETDRALGRRDELLVRLLTEVVARDLLQQLDHLALARLQQIPRTRIPREKLQGRDVVEFREDLLELGPHDLQHRLEPRQCGRPLDGDVVARAHQVAQLRVLLPQEWEAYELPNGHEIRDGFGVLRVRLDRLVVHHLLPALRVRGEHAHHLEALLLEVAGEGEAVDAGELDPDQNFRRRGSTRKSDHLLHSEIKPVSGAAERVRLRVYASDFAGTIL